MVTMWCYHRRKINTVAVTPHISKLVHVDDRTPCTGRHPKY